MLRTLHHHIGWMYLSLPHSLILGLAEGILSLSPICKITPVNNFGNLTFSLANSKSVGASVTLPS